MWSLPSGHAHSAQVEGKETREKGRGIQVRTAAKLLQQVVTLVTNTVCVCVCVCGVGGGGEWRTSSLTFEPLKVTIGPLNKGFGPLRVSFGPSM